MAPRRTPRAIRSGAGPCRNDGDSNTSASTAASPPSAEMIKMIAEAVIAAMNARPMRMATTVAPHTPEVAPVPVATLVPVVEPVVQANGRMDRELEYFLSLYPPTFKGVDTPTDAEDWLIRIKYLLKAAEISEERKVSLATFMLEGDVKHWWVEERNRLFPGRLLTHISMGEFATSFLRYYLPTSTRLALKGKFLRLLQQEMSVNAYHMEFTRLSRYAGNIIADEEEKRHRFHEGLRDNLRLPLITLKGANFSSLVEAARALEMDIEKTQRRKGYQGKSSDFKAPQLFGKSESGRYKKKSRRAKETPSTVSRATIARGSVTCFTCGKVGHKSFMCRSGPSKIGQSGGHYSCSRVELCGEGEGSQVICLPISPYSAEGVCTEPAGGHSPK